MQRPGCMCHLFSSRVSAEGTHSMWMRIAYVLRPARCGRVHAVWDHTFRLDANLRRVCACHARCERRASRRTGCAVCAGRSPLTVSDGVWCAVACPVRAVCLWLCGRSSGRLLVSVHSGRRGVTVCGITEPSGARAERAAQTTQVRILTRTKNAYRPPTHRSQFLETVSNWGFRTVGTYGA